MEPQTHATNSPILLTSLALISLLLSGAIFGFFYAWICSTMWGLDAADPKVAIAAMQAMNGSVRNAVFAPAFFGTPFVLILTALIAKRHARTRAASAFLAAGVIYFFGGLIATMMVNVPMNEALALVASPDDPATAAQIWADYSPKWQVWNIARTVASGISLMLTGYALLTLREAKI